MKYSLSIIVIIVLLVTLSLSGVVFAFTGPGSLSPGSGNGAFQVDSNFNIGFGTNLATPTGDSTNAVFGRVITIASSSDPGLALRNLSTGGGKYILYARSNGRFVIWDDTAFRPRLFIDSNGNVGIPGNGQFFFTPSSTLQVAGNIQTDAAFVGSMPATSIVGGAFSSSNYAFPSSLAIGTTTYTGLPTSGLYVVGNVGIGTIAPDEKLQVYGTAAVPSNTTNNGIFNIHSTTDAEIDFGLHSATPYAGWIQVKRGLNDGSSFPLALNPNGGNVGIGTSTPSQLLTVGNNNQFTVGNTGAVQANGYQCNGGSCSYSWGGDTTIYREAAAYDLGLRSGTNPMTFRIYNTYADASNYERLDISGNAGAAYAITSQAAGTGTARNITLMGGNVGIGTATPGQKLTVAGTIESTTGGIMFPDGSVQLTAGGNSSSIGWVRSGSYVSLATSTDWVGIGTATPSAPLQINNTATTTGGLYVKSSGYSSADPFRVYYTAGSANYLAIGEVNGAPGIKVPTGQTLPLHSPVMIGLGAPKIVIDSTGWSSNIWSNARSERLQVYGDVYASGNIVTGGTMTTNVGASNVSAGTFGFTAGKGNYRFEGAATTNDVLKVDATNERVGIGTGSPSYKLEIGSLSGAVEPTSLKISGSATNGTQIRIGDSYTGSIGTRYSGADTFVASNAYQSVLGTDSWAKTANTYSSAMLSLGIGISTSSPAFQIKYSPANTASGGITSFFTNDLFTVLGNGNVGIGTTGPGEKLEIAGNARISGHYKFTGAGAHYFKTEGGTAATDKFTFRFSDDQDVLTIAGDGNVGIGTTGPSQKLEVVQSGLNLKSAIVIGDYSTQATDFSELSLRKSNTITNGSNVTTAAGDILGRISAYGVELNPNFQEAARIDFVQGSGVVTKVPAEIQFWTSPGGSTAVQQRMVIDKTGNVGIGTTTPTSALHVIGDIRASGNVIAGGTMTANVSAPNVSAGTFGTTAGKGNYTFEAAANTNNVLKVDATNERVGIGTASPLVKFQVAGSIGISNGGIIGQGNAYGTPGNTYNGTLELYNGSTGNTTLQSATAYYLLLNPAGGNVGIGMTAPNRKLDVQNIVGVEDTTGTEKIYLYAEGGGADV
ncbi:MAG: hypothetical protein WC842_04205, partial [Candidatus Paceibacterota bacterium]